MSDNNFLFDNDEYDDVEYDSDYRPVLFSRENVSGLAAGGLAATALLVLVCSAWVEGFDKVLDTPNLLWGLVVQPLFFVPAVASALLASHGVRHRKLGMLVAAANSVTGLGYAAIGVLISIDELKNQLSASYVNNYDIGSLIVIPFILAVVAFAVVFTSARQLNGFVRDNPYRLGGLLWGTTVVASGVVIIVASYLGLREGTDGQVFQTGAIPFWLILLVFAAVSVRIKTMVSQRFVSLVGVATAGFGVLSSLYLVVEALGEGTQLAVGASVPLVALLISVTAGVLFWLGQSDSKKALPAFAWFSLATIVGSILASIALFFTILGEQADPYSILGGPTFEPIDAANFTFSLALIILFMSVSPLVLFAVNKDKAVDMTIRFSWVVTINKIVPVAVAAFAVVLWVSPAGQLQSVFTEWPKLAATIVMASFTAWLTWTNSQALIELDEVIETNEEQNFVDPSE
jgi:hypothetical protein